jgi:hypothetical protein
VYKHIVVEEQTYKLQAKQDGEEANDGNETGVKVENEVRKNDEN